MLHNTSVFLSQSRICSSNRTRLESSRFTGTGSGFCRRRSGASRKVHATHSRLPSRTHITLFVQDPSTIVKLEATCNFLKVCVSTIDTMSSPVSRRSKRSSVAGTPARSRTSQQRNGTPAAVQSTPLQRPGANVPMSSPMFFGSSPSNATPVGPPRQVVIDADRETTPGGQTQRPEGV